MTADSAAEFERARPRLFGVAYRMLGSAADAEDLVQDTWLRWSAVDRNAVRDPAAFLTTIVTRLAINALTSARARRETYQGPWLPEPVDTQADPALGAVRAEAVDFAVLLLMEKLTSTERAVFVLREAFGYSFAAIAETVDITESNGRQIFRRARDHVQSGRSAPVDREGHRLLLDAFLGAAGAGDMARLEAVLTESVVSLSDGGGKVTAARVPVVGRARVSQFLLGVIGKFGQGMSVDIVEVNGRAAARFSRAGDVVGVCTIEGTAAGIAKVMIVLEPSKLSRLGTARKSDGRTVGQEPG
ncbi:RNA polymerase sigma-70 factor [Rhodococcoides trifolii]|uniref:RNA polymerase sigma-70 factor n=1 Tax=Rhodococcoides trifolii TaxID=908250 RepID=UPI001E2BA927|nr:RNA polymerase sigma-70 factor [Rhodococcus trifolii]